MPLLKFTVRNQMLSGGGAKIVSDSIDYIDAEFDFRTEDWEGLSKWAHFTKGEKVYDTNLVADKIAKDAHVNLDEGEWELKLHGTDPEGTMRITTNTVYLQVESYGNTEEGEILPEIPLSAAEQIDAKAQEALVIANEIRERAEAGEFVGPQGSSGPEGPQGPQGERGIPGPQGTGIESITSSASSEDGGQNWINFYLTDGKIYGCTVLNGSKGRNGEPGLVWKGEWDPEMSYTAIKNGQFSRDVVSYNGSSYVAAVNNTAPVKGVVPEGDSSGKWILLAGKGKDGSGSEDLSAKINEIEAEIQNSAGKFIGNTAENTPAEVLDAMLGGSSILISYTDGGYGTIFFSNFVYSEEMEVVAASVVFKEGGAVLNASLMGSCEYGVWDFSVTRIAALEDVPEEKIVAAVDLSDYESEGKIVETYSDGSSLVYNFEFDGEGNPTKITDSSGNETVLTW